MSTKAFELTSAAAAMCRPWIAASISIVRPLGG